MMHVGLHFGESSGCGFWLRSGTIGADVRDMDLVAEYVEPAPVESPDDWVTLPPDHILRHTDEVMDIYGWWVNAPVGMHANKFRAARCRREDLLPVQPAMLVVDPGKGYRLLEPHEVTLPTDERAYSWSADDSSGWDTLTRANAREFVGVTVGSLKPSRPEMAIRRKLPPNTRTIILKEWVCWDDNYPDCIRIEWRTTDPSESFGLYCDTSEYDHAHATGNERTIEIPLT
jgi:hypothetical protein